MPFISKDKELPEKQKRKESLMTICPLMSDADVKQRCISIRCKMWSAENRECCFKLMALHGGFCCQPYSATFDDVLSELEAKDGRNDG